MYLVCVCVCVCVCDDQNLDPQPILRTSMFVCVYRIRMSLFSSECVEMQRVLPGEPVLMQEAC